MKLLLFYTPEFWYRPYRKTLPDASDPGGEQCRAEAVTVFFHVEEHDAGREPELSRKFAKNVKWLSGKFGTKTVVLHSFNHLSLSKAPPEVAREIVDAAIERLEHAGYSVTTTPFGYFNEWRMHVAGDSLAKVFKDL